MTPDSLFLQDMSAGKDLAVSIEVATKQKVIYTIVISANILPDIYIFQAKLSGRRLVYRGRRRHLHPKSG